MLKDYEKLGAFYLGRPVDPATRKPVDEPLLYDSKDLVTHAVCVGMTGSGKTGLCIDLLEEAAIDGVPAIVIDPKGDLSNLLLTFPNLAPADFEPWVNADDAARKGVDVPTFAKQQADAWAQVLASWGQSPERIAKLKDSADFSIYTPGSSAGLGVSILKSFAKPDDSVLEDAELFRETVATGVSGLLGLAGIDADPMQSREHILLSTIVANAWQNGKDIDLASLIGQVQEPPVQRVGVMDVESFFPRKDRFGLAMQLNNVMASPGFSNWTSGEPMDVGAFLRTKGGKPRVSIFSIAHLGDAERMFFVSILLNQVLAWTRAQPGTTSLRAIVYMDEIFGYLPPTANPPSKRPMLTLLKQARAFGVGVVLATQNPVDLDYKALSNCGTWFIGRLQTERDKMRVLDGLEGASAAASQQFDRAGMEKLLSSLGNRIFLMNNVHEDGPVLLESRWALSYLRGPLTRAQVKQLMDGKRGTPTAPASVSAGSSGAAGGTTSVPPVVAIAGGASYLPVRSVAPAGSTLVYKPAAFGSADVFFSDAKSGATAQERVVRLAMVADGRVALDWATAAEPSLGEEELEKRPANGAVFAALPSAAASAKSYDDWKTALADALYRTAKIELLKSAVAGLSSKPGESEREFRARLDQSSREQRDAAVEKLRQKYAPKLATLQDRIRRAEQAKAVQAQQASGAKWSAAMSVGATLLGAFFGRKAVSAGTINKATSAARAGSRAYEQSQDVTRAEENVQAIQQQLADVNAQMQADLDAAAAKYDAAAEQLERIPLRPKKTDVKVRLVTLAWAPHWQVGDSLTPAWE